MTGYIIRRLLQFIPVVLVATLIVYAMVFLMPGDPIRALGGDRPMSPEVQEALREQYNLNDPFLVQYGKYMWGVFTQADFGTTFQGRPVLDMIQQGLPVTVTLAVVAFCFQAVIGIIAGILAAVFRDSFIDRFIQVSLVIVVALPTLAIAFLLQLIFGVNLGWFPIAGNQEGLISYILPGIVLAAVSTGIVARMLRSELIEALQSDYVRTATAKGMKRSRVVVRHGLRNSLIPVVTFLGADLATMMGGTIVVESVFNLPGLGGQVFRSIQAQENTVVVGIVTLFVLFYVVINLLVDLLYAVLDPRIRYD
ncbi:ABC transporter permease [Auritidibacter ignavus]|uniref:ABC transporter permease n=1 Tax=Auritidibacter ignavus TaxID=678932 RepID=UPI000D731D87|nr:ABC transporter permease [Auritidibacter ignavus]NIH72488.1 ABC-type dipeptide/oligopeptide/nickel transport system permease component [Auritidibacter ignavus]PXA79484.1 ABC transporter permease [Auritidibacter sp. NML120779]RMX23107.1 ABC transporter permease [Auritidibacter ignavus]WGH90289.1 ABC transporter permease [Auritidibacter ignavus]